ncbi:Wall-associated receptor kinase 5 [Capsicum chinense]|nr:Wall-associated receptor kinase 5 [Capsicum chinense]
MVIFFDIAEDFVEVFMDDFSIFGNLFDVFLQNLDRVLAHFEETNLVLNWEKFYFLVKEGIVFGHMVSHKGLEVDKSQVDVIENLPYTVSGKCVRSFLKHMGFCRCIIKDFSNIASPICKLLEKEVSWYADIVNFLVSGIYPPDATSQQKKKLFHDSRSYMWDDPYLFKQGVDKIMRRCISEAESKQVLESYHSSPYRGHHRGERTARKMNSWSSHKFLIGNIEVYNISDAELRISNVIPWRCYSSNGSARAEDQHGWTHLRNSTYPYSFSIRNKFIVVGCDDNALITRHNFQIYCSTSCEADQFHFGDLQDLSHITFYDRIKASMPIVLDWAISNFSCKKAQDRKDYACKQNCHCVDSDTGLGWYRCSCNKGYEGNPYLSPGCQDIDECADPSINLCEKMCINIPRSYDCCCPEGYTGDGKKNGCGCIAPSSKFPLIKFTLGTLYEHIHNQRRAGWLTWPNRLRIAADIATTLAYLHSFASMPIIHRDVKSANILLDNVYTAKVADFGASRLIPLDQTHVATLVLGTSGYLGPEYFRTSQLIEKSDVYSFGVVLAELLTGLKPIIKARNEDKNLADYVVLSMYKNNLFHIIGRRGLREGSLEQLQKMGELVKNCLRPHGEDRLQ